MTESRGPVPGEARGDGRRPWPVVGWKFLPPEPPGLVRFVVLRGEYQGNHGMRPMFWTIGVRSDGTVVRTAFQGAVVPSTRIPGIVLDLARTLVLDEWGLPRPGWQPS
jgi:hypothetical protein